MTTKKGRVIDLDTANETMIVDVFDLMASLGRCRDTIRRQIKSGVLPPPLDRVGNRYRWTVGLLRNWNQIRTEQALSMAKPNKPFKIPANKTSEFG